MSDTAGDTAQAGGGTAQAGGDTAQAGGGTAQAGGDTAQAGGDTAQAGGDTAQAGGTEKQCEMCNNIFCYQCDHCKKYVHTTIRHQGSKCFYVSDVSKTCYEPRKQDFKRLCKDCYERRAAPNEAGDTAQAGGDTAQAGGDTAQAGGDTAQAVGTEKQCEMCNKIFCYQCDHCKKYVHTTIIHRDSKCFYVSDVSTNPPKYQYQCLFCRGRVLKEKKENYLFCHLKSNKKSIIHKTCYEPRKQDFKRLCKDCYERRAAPNEAGDTAQAGGDTAQAGGDTAQAGGDTAQAGGDTAPLVDEAQAGNTAQTGDTDAWAVVLPSKASESHYACFQKKGLHFLNINANGLKTDKSKMDELRCLAMKCNAAVIGVTESGLDDGTNLEHCSIPGYTILRRDGRHDVKGSEKLGRGVCMYIKSHIAYIQRPDLSRDGLTSIWAELRVPEMHPILTGVCYRQREHVDFYESLEESLSFEYIIMGDFNTTTRKSDKKQLDGLTKFKERYGLKQMIDEKTHKGCNILDLIMVSEPQNTSDSGVLDICLSPNDHKLTYYTRRLNHRVQSLHVNTDERQFEPGRSSTSIASGGARHKYHTVGHVPELNANIEKKFNDVCDDLRMVQSRQASQVRRHIAAVQFEQANKACATMVNNLNYLDKWIAAIENLKDDLRCIWKDSHKMMTTMGHKRSNSF